MTAAGAGRRADEHCGRWRKQTYGLCKDTPRGNRFHFASRRGSRILAGMNATESQSTTVVWRRHKPGLWFLGVTWVVVIAACVSYSPGLWILVIGLGIGFIAVLAANQVTITLTPQSVIYRDSFGLPHEDPRTRITAAITYQRRVVHEHGQQLKRMFALLGPGNAVLLKFGGDHWVRVPSRQVIDLASELPAALGVTVTDLGVISAELRAYYPGL
jgi:hypothetical protein